ncbi:MAG: hypothetical protein J7K26_03435 [Candidatus Aenigmarchaeota archaeon]|nr:hypothetical protein [Candidatus Aenigmarchaeota archaeon]
MKNKNMQGKYLSTCLDSCRWGSTITIMYDLSIRELIDFIISWKKQNKNNFQNLWHENEKEIEKIYSELKLPYIDYDACPRNNKHTGKIKCLDGVIRCAHIEEKKLEPDFTSHVCFDDFSQMKKREYYNPITQDILPDNHLNKREQLKNEESTFIVKDTCFAIISDKKASLSLETIIKRLNLRPETERIYCNGSGPCKRLNELDKESREFYEHCNICPGHIEEHKYVEFPFGGLTLALYVRKWYEQVPDDNAPVFEKDILLSCY